MKATTRTLPLLLAWMSLAALGLSGCINSHDSDTAQQPGSSANTDNDADEDNGGNGTHAINGSIHVSSSAPGGEVSTINGSIHADDNAQLAAGHTSTATSARGSRHGHLADDGQRRHFAGRRRPRHRDGDHRQRHPCRCTPAPRSAAAWPTSRHHHPAARRRCERRLSRPSTATSISAPTRTCRAALPSHKPSTGFFHWWSESDKPRVVVGPGAVIEGTPAVREGGPPVRQRHGNPRPGHRGDAGQVFGRQAARLKDGRYGTDPCSRAMPSSTLRAPRESPKARRISQIRDVAQPGRALRSGRRCRRFKSCHPDH